MLKITNFTEPYGIIYMIRNIINDKKYIGQTIKKINERSTWLEESILRNYNGNPHLINSIKKYNFKNFERKIIDIGHNQKDLDEKEEYYIQKYNTLDPNYGYNLKHGGSHGKHTKKTKKKISEKLKGKNHYKFEKTYEEVFGEKKAKELKNQISKAVSGENNPMFGKKHTIKSKKQMSKNKKGQVSWNKGLTKETSEGLRTTSEKLKGREFSKEHRMNISEAKKGKYGGENLPMYGKKRSDLSERNKRRNGKKYEEIYGKEKTKERTDYEKVHYYFSCVCTHCTRFG